MDIGKIVSRVVMWISQAMGIAVLMLGAVTALEAQYLVSVKAGLIQFVDGDAFLDEKLLRISKENMVQMENGQVLRTRRGRAELLLSPDVYIRLDENGLLRMEQNQIHETQMALKQGNAFVEVVEKIKGNRIRMCVGPNVIEIKEAGLYRIHAAPGELRVYRGAALVTGKSAKIVIKSDKLLHLEETFSAAAFDVNGADSFHQWSARRSFDLFLSTELTRRQSHWRPVAMGWITNFGYHMRFYSQLFFDKWLAVMKKEKAEEAIKAALEASAADQNRAVHEALDAIKEAKDAGEQPEIPVR